MPCVYALLPNKSTQTYRRLFQIVKRFRPNILPRTCIIDFEVAAKRAITEEFQGTSVQGCFFHLTQSVWRKVQNVGLVEKYTNSNEIRSFVKALCSLAFLPENEVDETFEELQEEIETYENIRGLKELYDYFEDTYIGRLNRRQQRRNPQFPKTMWNVRSRTLEGIPRTTNKIEAWHKAIQAMFDAPHPSIYRFFHALQKEEVLQVGDLNKLRAGNDLQKQKKIYQEANKRITTLMERYQQNECGRKEFLRGVGYNISMNC